MPVAASAGAEPLIEPGQWKVTQGGVMNGAAMPPQVKMRCITPEQASDVAATFGPMSGTINSTCDAPSVATSERILNWRLQCGGQLDVDVAAQFNFESSSRYTATIASLGRMGGITISDVRTDIVGERIGDCQQ